MKICKGYFDDQGKEYKIGDIVYNPAFGDYWIVKESKPEYALDCPYCLILWNNEDEYVTELNTPKGFLIVTSFDELYYNQALEIINKIAEQRRKLYGK